MRQFLYCLCQWTWGFPQTLLGAILWLGCRKNGQDRYHGAVVSYWDLRWSASVGMFLFIAKQDADCRRLWVHEYGHTLQSLVLGPLYLPVIGLPSMLWMLLPCCRKFRRRKRISYYSFYTERWADRFGERICREPSMGT